MARNYPPLWLWLTTGIFATILLFILILQTDELPFDPNTYLRPERLEKFTNGNLKSDPALPQKIVVLGTSLTRRAFFFDEEMERFAKKNRGLDIQFIRFSISSATLEQYEAIFDEIIHAKPDYVFFESQILLYTFNLSKIKYLTKKINHLRDNIFDFIYRKTGLDFNLFHLQNTEYFDLMKDWQNIKKQPRNEMENDGKGIKKFDFRSMELPEIVISFFRDIKVNGGKIFILEIPWSQMAKSQIPDSLLIEINNRKINMSQKYGLPIIDFPGYPKLNFYYDFGHFNAEGRKMYSKWYLGEIAKLNQSKNIN